MRPALGRIFLLIWSVLLVSGFPPISEAIASGDDHTPGTEASSRVKDGVITIDKDTFARADMALSSVLAVEDKITVPASAVVWWEGKSWVYAQADTESYRRHAVTILSSAPEGIYEVADLPGDASIITRGAQLLLSEEFGSGTESEEHH